MNINDKRHHDMSLFEVIILTKNVNTFSTTWLTYTHVDMKNVSINHQSTYKNLGCIKI
jgi:hypothetical protein